MNQPLDPSDPPPMKTSHVSLFAALSIYPLILSKARWSITAVMKFVKSSASPILILETSSENFEDILDHTVEGMYALLAAEHF